MKGLIILKKQNGKYDKVATPNAADIYAPQVFHGIKGEVIVAPSSNVLDKF